MGRFSDAVEHVRREPGLGRNVVALGVVLVMGMVCGGYILSQQRFNPPWEDSTFVYATFAQAPAVAPGRGQEVRMSGVTVGDLRAAETTEQGNARLLLAIDPDRYGGEIYDNATVVLRPKSPLNEMYIEMDPGSPAGTPLPDYGVLPVERSRYPIQVDASLAQLDQNALAGLQSLLAESDEALARAPEEFPAGLAAADTLAQNLRPVAVELDTRRDALARLITAVSQLSTALGEDDERLTALAERLQTTLGTFSARNQDLRDTLNRLPGVVTELDSATTAVADLSDQLDPTLDDLLGASAKLPGALEALSDTADDLGDTVDAAKPVAFLLKPVVADLRPFVKALKDSGPELRSISHNLQPVTAGLVDYLPDLQAFVHQTNSVVSLSDANGGILRGMLQGGPGTVPVPGSTELSPTPR
ncbi:MAG: MlaD family protein [Pseudonocardia sp.]